MDGHFVPNLSMGAPLVAQLCANRRLPIDVHLMVSNPLEQLDWYLESAPDSLTVHWEALDEADRVGQAGEASKRIRATGALAAVSVKPDTPVSVLEPTLKLWDMVLVMSVYPGFSGQSFIESTPQRIAELVGLCEQAGVSPLIQVDGGMNPETAELVASAGADCLVAGNAFFKASDRAGVVATIRQRCQAAQEARW